MSTKDTEPQGPVRDVDEIQVPSLQPFVGADGKPLHALRCPARVNLLVGPNNSGKSRLLRHVVHHLDKRTARLRSRSFDVDAFNRRGEEACARLKDVLENHGHAEDRKVHLAWRVDKWGRVHPPAKDVLAKLASRLPSAYPRGTSNEGDRAHELHRFVRQRVAEFEQEVKALEAEVQASTVRRIQPVYVPVLRGVRLLADASESDPYTKVIVADHGLSAGAVFSGQAIYESIRRHKNAEFPNRERLEAFEDLIARLLDFERVVLTADADSGKVLLDYTTRGGWRDERALHELGDGLQAVLNLIFPFFTSEVPTMIFIEEPEHHLHPGLLRRLIEFMAGDENPHVWWLTTHSNHLLDMSLDLDLSIHRLRRRENNVVVELVYRAERSTLHDLGVRNSSVFLVNATIWVEGISDRAYLRAWFRALERVVLEVEATWRPPMEDRDYGFVEYGGANLGHWAFADEEETPEPAIDARTLTAEAFLLADHDGAMKDRVAEVESALGDRFARTVGREIESMIPEPVWRDALTAHERSAAFRPDDFRLPALDDPAVGVGTAIEGAVRAAGGVKKYAAGKEDSPPPRTLHPKGELRPLLARALADLPFEQNALPVRSLILRIYGHVLTHNGKQFPEGARERLLSVVSAPIGEASTP